jgi:hypothetical protein
MPFFIPAPETYILVVRSATARSGLSELSDPGVANGSAGDCTKKYANCGLEAPKAPDQTCMGNACKPGLTDIDGAIEIFHPRSVPLFVTAGSEAPKKSDTCAPRPVMGTGPGSDASPLKLNEPVSAPAIKHCTCAAGAPVIEAPCSPTQEADCAQDEQSIGPVQPVPLAIAWQDPDDENGVEEHFPFNSNVIANSA